MDNANWFTEVASEAGSAFSLKISKKLHEEQTPFQKIEIYQTEDFGNLMVIDGFIMLSTRDNFFYHEMMSHLVIYTHPGPETVWIIGGGDCGTLREVLKHRQLQKVIQIDIDERVTRLAEQYFPELCQSNDDVRAELKFVDGIEWVKQAQPETVDIIIIDSTDPIGPAEGLFSKDFYQDCFNCLSDQGIIIQQSESALYHMQILRNMRKAMSEAGFSHLQTLFFPQCVYPSGWWSATMAGKNDLTTFRCNDSANKKFSTNYYNSQIHQAALAQPEFFKKAMQVSGVQ